MAKKSDQAQPEVQLELDWDAIKEAYNTLRVANQLPTGERCPVCNHRVYIPKGGGTEVQFPEGYLNIKEAAEYMGIGAMRTRQLCKEEVIEGAIKVGGQWAVPVEGLDKRIAQKKANAEKRKERAAKRAAERAAKEKAEATTEVVTDEETLAALDELLGEEEE
jgi:hypothetical protein